MKPARCVVCLEDYGKTKCQQCERGMCDVCDTENAYPDGPLPSECWNCRQYERHAAGEGSP